MTTAKATDNIYTKLLAVQKTAKSPRDVSGKFGKSRSAERILEAYKPVCNDNGLYLFTTDVIIRHGDRNYVETTATVINTENPTETHSATAEAWENIVEMSKGGSAILDTSQVTGKTSSYAKKYALQNLFAIDDTKDADNDKDFTPPAHESPEKVLIRAKKAINEALVQQGYDTLGSKSAFVFTVLEHATIDNLDEADLVMDALENEKGAGL